MHRQLLSNGVRWQGRMTARQLPRIEDKAYILDGKCQSSGCRIFTVTNVTVTRVWTGCRIGALDFLLFEDFADGLDVGEGTGQMGMHFHGPLIGAERLFEIIQLRIDHALAGQSTKVARLQR